MLLNREPGYWYLEKSQRRADHFAITLAMWTRCAEFKCDLPSGFCSHNNRQYMSKRRRENSRKGLDLVSAVTERAAEVANANGALIHGSIPSRMRASNALI